MRMMMTVSLPTAKTNEAVRNGKMTSVVQKALGEIKPEATYFTTDHAGRRCALIFFDMTSSSQMPKLAEPFFLTFDAEVSLQPVMTPEDLATATGDLEHAAKNY